MFTELNGFECEKNNGIYTKCENGYIYTIIRMDYSHYNCYFNFDLIAENVHGLKNAIDILVN